MTESISLDERLVLACTEGDLAMVKELVENGADVCYQDITTGISVLMVSASAGFVEVVRYLLEEGAPWNAVDRSYMCAGDYAAKHGQQECIDVLLDHAVMSELLLSLTIERGEWGGDVASVDGGVFATDNKTLPPTSLNASYLSSHLEYSKNGTCLVDTDTRLAVMMDWERPLMAKHAAWICHADSPLLSLRVLNVGFGMGIVDGEIQKYHPSSHIIIEAHPEVLKKMETDGWLAKPGISVMQSRWQDAVRSLAEGIAKQTIEPFDGIFFDTYAEDDMDLRDFHSWLPNLLRCGCSDTEPTSGSRYSYYNGVCPDNVFFHGVACETLRLHLNRFNIDCTFEPIPVDVGNPEMWKNLAKRYWYFDTYFLPKCMFKR